MIEVTKGQEKIIKEKKQKEKNDEYTTYNIHKGENKPKTYKKEEIIKRQKNEYNNGQKILKEKKDIMKIIPEENKENYDNEKEEEKEIKGKVKKEIKIQITISKPKNYKKEKEEILNENRQKFHQKIKNFIKRKEEQKEKRSKIFEQMNFIKVSKNIKSLFKHKTPKKIEKKPEFRQLKYAESDYRPHYANEYNQRKYDSFNNSSFINSCNFMPYNDRSNSKLYCSFGPRGYNNNSEKNFIHLPIGVASVSASRSSLYRSPKKYIRLTALKTELLPNRRVNIFKPVPKNIIQTTIMESKIQSRQYEGYRTTNNNNNVKKILYNYRNNNNNKSQYNTESLYRNKVNQKLKYYVKCPHCNFPLNDENEINNYYNREKNNNDNNRNSYNNNNTNQSITSLYSNKNTLDNENNNKKIKIKIFDNRNKKNDSKIGYINFVKNKGFERPKNNLKNNAQTSESSYSSFNN
jgi:hypothetical protein